MANAPNPESANTASAAPPPSADDETAVPESKIATGTFALRAPSVAGEVGTLGPYRIVKQLGKGGMGAVYLATDTRLERKIALKLMLPEFAADPDAKDRFLREARAAAKIAHDNVVTVYEADERDGIPYIAMQFLQGAPLDEFLRTKGPPPLAHCVRIGIEAARGLAAAHELGLVHRDIKPANLWLEAPNGRVKVLDFGLAKPIGTDTELTKSGMVMGTPAYMSPEQARATKVDHRTDVFSLGTVMYKLLTGHNPFVGANVMAVLMALGTDDPVPIRERNPAVPEALAALVMRMLAKKPEARPQTALEVANGLRAALAQPAAPASADVSQSLPVVVHALPHPVQPLQVPGAPESAFANLLDDDAPTEREPAPVRAEPAPTRGKGLLIGGGALVGTALVGVAIALGIGGKKPDDVAKTDPPPAPPPIQKDKDKPPPKVESKVLPVPDDEQRARAAAAWVLSAGGSVRAEGSDAELRAVADLPKGAFRLAGVRLSGSTAVTADGLALIARCRQLNYLGLGQSNVTDAAFKKLAGLSVNHILVENTALGDDALAAVRTFTDLHDVHLEQTQITNKGLAHLRGVKLNGLFLHVTAVTDEGLKALEALDDPHFIILTGTKVTDAGAKKLAQAHPGCRILWDGGVIEPRAKAGDDRAAAEWALGAGGTVQVRIRDVTTKVRPGEDLPAEPFRLNWVSLVGSQRVTDAGLQRLAEQPNLRNLYLARTPTSDAGLAHLKGLKMLYDLTLNETDVTDVGLAHLVEVTSIEWLNLSGLAGVTDAGLLHLSKMAALKSLDLSRTKVTATGVAGLAKALPACRIVWDGETIEPKK